MGKSASTHTACGVMTMLHERDQYQTSCSINFTQSLLVPLSIFGHQRCHFFHSQLLHGRAPQESHLQNQYRSHKQSKHCHKGYIHSFASKQESSSHCGQTLIFLLSLGLSNRIWRSLVNQREFARRFICTHFTTRSVPVFGSETPDSSLHARLRNDSIIGKFEGQRVRIIVVRSNGTALCGLNA